MKTYGRLERSDPSAQTQETYGIRKTFFVHTEPHVMMKLRRWFDRSRVEDTGRLVLTDTPETANDLLFMLGRWPLEMSHDDLAYLEQRSRQYLEARDAVISILDSKRTLASDQWLEPAVPPINAVEPLMFPGVPVWQTVPADVVETSGRTCCSDELGLGKTYEALLMLRNPEARPALIVCPAPLQLQWMAEVKRFWPQLRCHLVKSTKVYDPAKDGGDPDVLVISYAKLDAWAAHLAGRIQYVVFEEAHELRTGGHTLKYRAAVRIARECRFRLMLTGTPVFNYGGDAHTILSVLDRDALGTREEFVREWGKDLGRGKVGVREPRALGSYLRDQALVVRRTFEELGIPKTGATRVPHEVDIDQKRLDALMDGAVDLAELILDRTADHKEVFTARGELDWKMRHATGVAKAPYVAAFVKLLLDSTEKVVLWGWHHDVYKIWLKKLAGYAPVLYTGKQSIQAKERALAQFVGGERLERLNAGISNRSHQAYESRVLIMSLRSGQGVDGLQTVSNVGVMGELDWSPAVHDQDIGRLDRIGQTEHVTAYFLHAAYGSDPFILETLGIKRQQVELIRDPKADILAAGNDATDHVRLLAESVLARRGARTKVAA